MKIYVITVGEYSDYHICAVTLDENKAEILRKAFSDSWDEAMIEEYDTEEYEPIGIPCWEVVMTSTDLKVKPLKGLVSASEVSYSKRAKKYFVYVKAKDEDHAKKIGLDKIMKFKAGQLGL